MTLLSASTSMGILDVMSAIGSLLVIVLVIVLAYFASRWYARRLNGAGGAGFAGKYVKVVDRASLGQGVTLVVVEVADKHYMVGVSEKNVQLLCELEDFQKLMDETPSEGTADNFSKMFRSLLGKTGHSGKNRDEGGAE